MEIQMTGMRYPVWLAGLAVWVIALVASRQTQYSRSHLICSAVLGVYVLIAIDILFFPIVQLDMSQETGWLSDSFVRSVNLIPLRFDFTELPNIVMMQIVLNVLVSVPFGFGILFVVFIQTRQIPVLAVVVGLGIEGIQLVIGLLLRYPYRIIDINDAILNALGVLLGYALFRVFAGLYLQATDRFRLQHHGLTAYVYAVSRQTQSFRRHHEV